MFYLYACVMACILGLHGLNAEDSSDLALIETVGLQFQYEGSWGLSEPIELDNGRTRIDLRYKIPEIEHTSTFIRFETMRLDAGHAKIIEDNLDVIERQTLDGFEDHVEGFELIGNHRFEILDAEAFVIDCLASDATGCPTRMRFYFFVLHEPDRLITIYLRADADAWEEHHQTMEQFVATLEPIPHPNQPDED